MKLIFLDIDGVLNSYATRPPEKPSGLFGMHKELVDRLNEITKHTEALVVVSSTWRISERWRKTMKENGIKRVLARTPVMRGEIRGKEIEAFLRGHFPKPENYVILDDDSDFLPDQMPHHFKTSIFEGGLTQEIADKIVAYLGPVELSPAA